MIMIVISFALVKFYAFAILYVLIVMQIKLVVVVVVVVVVYHPSIHSLVSVDIHIAGQVTQSTSFLHFFKETLQNRRNVRTSMCHSFSSILQSLQSRRLFYHSSIHRLLSRTFT